jgi:ABC-type multidrug transport system fused ATPase/permease subunit
MKRTFRLLKPYILKHKKAYIALFLLMVIDIALILAYAWFIGSLTDAAVHRDFDRLKGLLFTGVGITAISISTNFMDTYLETVAVNAVKRDLNLDLYKHILLLPGNHVSNVHSGELLSHFTNEIHNVDGIVGRGLINLVRYPVISIASFIYLVQISWKLSLLSLLVVPVAVIGGAVFGWLLRNNSRLIHTMISSINKSLNDTFQGFVVIRSFTLEKLFFAKYARMNQDLYSLELKDAKLRGWFYAGGEAVGASAFLASFVAGAYFVSGNVITIGALLSFITLVGRMVNPLTGLAGQWASYQRSLSAIERIINLLDQPRESKELPSFAPTPQLLHKRIHFDDISFSYDGQKNVFEHFHLQIPKGQVAAIVGPSGAGKSTLFHLLQGLYRCQSGSILIDDASIEDITLSGLRNMIAYVPQETFLFSGTIKDNLMLARPGISEADMIQASRSANIHEFITALPEGYDTEIGERGVKLSGGQRQRISIARAILKDAPILLLDEATSALDSETEFLVKDALDRLMKNRTTLIIAHRISTIQHADVIVVLDQGKIVQMGKHHELINEQGLYSELNKIRIPNPSSATNPLAANAL